MKKNDRSKSLSRIKIVLVNPKSCGNIGSVCRAMKTMGIHNLSIISDKEYDEETIRSLSVHAYDIFESAERHSDLPDALKNTVYSAGVTRRKGSRRKYHSVLPEDLAARLSQYADGISAVVFGNEEHGLTKKELSFCNDAVLIPSSPEFPSLNLSHAVQVITYNLYRGIVPSGGYNPVDRERIEKMTESIVFLMDELGFFIPSGKEDMEIFVRDMLARSSPDRKEADRIESIYYKLQGIIRSKI
jgi:tRNA/rRNA methyltransferase